MCWFALVALGQRVSVYLGLVGCVLAFGHDGSHGFHFSVCAG